MAVTDGRAARILAGILVVIAAIACDSPRDSGSATEGAPDRGTTGSAQSESQPGAPGDVTPGAPPLGGERGARLGEEREAPAGAETGFAGVSEALPTGAAAIDPTGLVAAYDMETRTADGLLRDFSGNRHHGSFTRANLVEGVRGRARLYRAVADRVFLRSRAQLDLDGPLTIAAWVRVDEAGLHQHIFACDDKWALWVTPDNRYRLGDTRGGGWSTAPDRAQAGYWTPVVAVLRGAKGEALGPDVVSLWVDGEPADADIHLRTEAAQELGTWNPGALYPDDACYIGFESHQDMESHRTLPFVGAIDELLLFARAWSDDEVRAFSRLRRE